VNWDSSSHHHCCRPRPTDAAPPPRWGGICGRGGRAAHLDWRDPIANATLQQAFEQWLSAFGLQLRGHGQRLIVRLWQRGLWTMQSRGPLQPEHSSVRPEKCSSNGRDFKESYPSLIACPGLLQPVQLHERFGAGKCLGSDWMPQADAFLTQKSRAGQLRF
jgi:hypothetical protein